MMSKAAPTSVVASANNGTRPVSVLTSTTYWLSGTIALVATIAAAIGLIPVYFYYRSLESPQARGGGAP